VRTQTTRKTRTRSQVGTRRGRPLWWWMLSTRTEDSTDRQLVASTAIRYTPAHVTAQSGTYLHTSHRHQVHTCTRHTDTMSKPEHVTPTSGQDLNTSHNRQVHTCTRHNSKVSFKFVMHSCSVSPTMRVINERCIQVPFSSQSRLLSKHWL
jgi:hypothetical protein